MESLGQLAGGIAHELNNILQPIFFAVDTIERRVPDDDLVVAASEKITACTTKAADIIDDILAFSRQDTDRLDFLPLENVFEEALKFSQGLLPSTVSVKTKSISSEDYWAWVNEVDMVRILTNLFVNASDAMENSGTINVELSYVTISDKNHIDNLVGDTLRIGKYACMAIKDHGHGCSPEDTGNLFDPFYTTKDIGEGTGIGLSIVYKIIQNWNGGISVNSQKGKGAQFLVYIPVYKTGED